MAGPPGSPPATTASRAPPASRSAYPAAGRSPATATTSTSQDPGNSGIYLLIDQSTTPKQDTLADWEQQQASRASGYPGYHLIRLEPVGYPQAEQAADWEFTYDSDGVDVHILNRNVLANAHHAYAAP